MDKTTQAQKFWLMGFNSQLMSVTLTVTSVQFWETKADHTRRLRGETDEELANRRACYRSNAQAMREARNEAEEKLTAWVIAHPYPKGVDDEGHSS